MARSVGLVRFVQVAAFAFILIALGLHGPDSLTIPPLLLVIALGEKIDRDTRQNAILAAMLKGRPARETD